jgi:transcriptional regulator with XRE-family HTH domain
MEKKIDIKAIGSRIKEIRKSLGILQDEFANTLNVSSPTLSDVENGKTKAGFDILYHLQEVYHVDLAFILQGEGTPFKEKKAAPQDTIDDFYFGEFTPDIKEILFYMHQSRFFLGFVISLCKDYLQKNESIIKRDIKESRANKPEKVSKI